MTRFDVVSIFPDYLAPLGLSLIGKASQSGLIDVHVHDLRAAATDRHRTVDDTPYGGGPGMVMTPQPWADTLSAVRAADPSTRPTLVVPSPSGSPFTQAMAQDLATRPWLVFACGRYEGIDRRVIEHAADEFDVVELSLGDYVINGGEVAALVVIEAVVRLLPGVVGNAESVVDDSFAPGSMESLLEGPVYTKPATWEGRDVPPVLLSGDHGAIARWRRDQALIRTSSVRPDLLAGLDEASTDRRDAEVLSGLGWVVADGRWQAPGAPMAD